MNGCMPIETEPNNSTIFCQICMQCTSEESMKFMAKIQFNISFAWNWLRIGGAMGGRSVQLMKFSVPLKNDMNAISNGFDACIRRLCYSCSQCYSESLSMNRVMNIFIDVTTIKIKPNGTVVGLLDSWEYNNNHNEMSKGGWYTV